VAEPLDPFAGVATERVVDLLLAGESVPDETRTHLYTIVGDARKAFPTEWGWRFAEAYKQGLRERWAREIAMQVRAEFVDPPLEGAGGADQPAGG
jgi:hypothetical protein